MIIIPTAVPGRVRRGVVVMRCVLMRCVGGEESGIIRHQRNIRFVENEIFIGNGNVYVYVYNCILCM